VVLPDQVVRQGAGALIRGRAARRVVLVSSAPAPGSTPALREFEAAFAAAYRRRPGPYAAQGYAAMTTVLAAVTTAARDGEAGERQRVLEAFFGDASKDTVLGPLTLQPSGELAPARFSARALRSG
jgi:ABC-type branched-subunit amino acid transport system substrate-binding protein